MTKGIDPEGVTIPPDLFVIKGYGDKVHVRQPHGWSSYCGHVPASAMWRTNLDVTCRACAKSVSDQAHDQHRPVVPWGETMNDDSVCRCGLLWLDCCETTRLEEILAKSTATSPRPLKAEQVQRLVAALGVSGTG